MRVVSSFEEHWAYDDANGHHSLDVSINETQEWNIVDTRMEGEEGAIAVAVPGAGRGIRLRAAGVRLEFDAAQRPDGVPPGGLGRGRNRLPR
jgi:hypothetical protein